MDSYLVELVTVDETGYDASIDEAHRFRFPDDACDCALALAEAHGRARVRCWFWLDGCIRYPDGTVEPVGEWESMSLADLESDAATF